MKMKKLALACGVCLSLTSSAVVMAENTLSANLGVASNYIWRGVTQTQDDPAISGGLDYVMENGFGGIDEARMATALEQLAKNYEFQNAPDASLYFDASYLPEGLFSLK